jgi:hypothetical protein
LLRCESAPVAKHLATHAGSPQPVLLLPTFANVAVYCRLPVEPLATSDMFVDFGSGKLRFVKLSNFNLSNFNLSNYNLSNFNLSNFNLSNFDLSNLQTEAGSILFNTIKFIIINRWVCGLAAMRLWLAFRGIKVAFVAPKLLYDGELALVKFF